MTSHTCIFLIYSTTNDEVTFILFDLNLLFNN